MAIIYSEYLSLREVEALEMLKKAKHKWLSDRALYFGDGRDLSKDTINVLEFYDEDYAERFVKLMNLKLDKGKK